MNNMIKISLLSLALLHLASCTAIQGDPVDRADRQANALAPRIPKTPFDETLAKAALQPGKVEIKSVLVNCYGRGMGCIQGSLPVANTAVYLYPYTPYMQEYLAMDKRLQADIKKHPDYAKVKITVDPRLLEYRLTAKTDEFGRYGFKNIKPGKYYIESDSITGHRTVVGHYYDEYGVDHPRQVDSPAILTFDKVVDITQATGVVKFESTMKIFKITGLNS